MKPFFLIPILLFASLQAYGEIDPQGLKNHVNQVVTNLDEKDQFSGAVLIAHGNDVIFSKAVGPASKEYGINNELHTKFDLGTATSLFTLVAIGQLIDEGKLSLQDSVNKYISSKLLPKVNLSSLQIVHLLTASSGLGNMYANQKRSGLSLWDRSNKMLFTTIGDYLPLIPTESMSFLPGAGHKFSTTAILLLGAIIEEVSGESFYDFIQKRVFKVADMQESGFYTLSYPIQHVATGYSHHQNSMVNNLFSRAAKGSPASGAYSTVGDMLKFFQAMNNLSLVSRKVHDQIFTPYMGLNTPTTSNGGIGPSKAYQGLLFELHYPNANPSLNTSGKHPFDGQGIQGVATHRYVASICSESKDLSVTIEMIAPSGYVTIILGNYGEVGQGYKESPSEMIASKVRRYIFNGIRSQ